MKTSRNRACTRLRRMPRASHYRRRCGSLSSRTSVRVMRPAMSSRPTSCCTKRVRFFRRRSSRMILCRLRFRAVLPAQRYDGRAGWRGLKSASHAFRVTTVNCKFKLSPANRRAFMRRVSTFLVVCVCLLVCFTASAQTERSVNTAHLSSAPATTPIELQVDATDAPRRVLHAHMTIPVSAGPLTLYYPEWIPGEHGPTGPITDLVNLKFTAGRQTLAWQRDQADMYTFHLDVPTGVKTLEATLDFLFTTNTEGFSSGASASAQLAVISWNQILLYPAGRPAEEITFAPSLRLPAGWKYGTALERTREERGTIEFAPVALVTLIDSPVLTGANFRVIPLATTP